MFRGRNQIRCLEDADDTFCRTANATQAQRRGRHDRDRFICSQWQQNQNGKVDPVELASTYGRDGNEQHCYYRTAGKQYAQARSESTRSCTSQSQTRHVPIGRLDP